VKIFLSHAAADGAIAEQVVLALRELDCDVFFDRASLAPGEGFHERIREQVEDSDLFVILVSRNALREHSYCLTEIEFAEQRWPHPTGHVLPVLIEPLKPAELPAFLTAITFLEPKGNLVAETAAAVALLAKRIRRRRLLRVAAVVAAVALVASVGVALYRGNIETGPVRALAGSLRHRARAVCAPDDASDSRLLIALADPPELVEFDGGDAARVLAKLDAEPVALAVGDGAVAVATTSPTPIHLFRGAGLDPLAPLAVAFHYGDSAQHPNAFATQPVQLAVFDDRVWVETLDPNRAPGFSAYLYLPGVEQWKLPYYGYYTYDQLVEFGAWARGARLRVVDEHLYALTRDGDHSVLAVADEEFAVLSEAADGPFACARDIARGPERSFVLLGCDGELVRLTRDDIGDFGRESLGKVALRPHAANVHVDHLIACAPGRVLLAFTARDGSDSGPVLWTQLWTWDQVAGLRNLYAIDGQEAVSIATTSKFGVVVLHTPSRAWDALEVVY
jgi:hypothetical protein